VILLLWRFKLCHSGLPSEVKYTAINGWAIGGTDGELEHGKEYGSLADFDIRL